jgi:ribosomal protein S18 acetylase RimI-like enzyme
MFLLRKPSQKIFILTKVTKDHILGYSNFGIIKNTTYIHSIYVDDINRKSNIGSSMLKYIEDYSKMYNVDILKLVAMQEQNGNLVNFYEKNGFNKVLLEKSILDTYDDGETMYDMIPMEKSLRS